MKKIKRLITNTIIGLTPTHMCGENVSVYNNTDAIKYFTACGISITNVYIPQYDRIVFVIDDKYDTISRLDVTTFGMSYRQLVCMYDKSLSLGPGFVKVIRALTRALANADLINIDQISVESITDTFEYIITNIIERNGISGNILSSKNIHLLLKKFGGTKGLTKLLEEAIDASMDLCLLGKSPSNIIKNKCSTCSRCRIVDNVRTCDDRYISIDQKEDLSKYPDLHFSSGKLWSEYIFKPQTRCSLYSTR